MLQTEIFTEVGAAWDGVRVRRVQRPAADVWLAAIEEHYLCLNAGKPHRLTYECAGSAHSGVRGTGDMVLTPASHPSRWRKEEAGEGMHLFVAPSLLARVATEMGSRGDARIRAAFCVQDPQVEHIGLALLAEAEQGRPGGRLYGESLAVALAVHLLGRYRVEATRNSIVSTGLSPAQLRRALDLLHGRLDADLSLARIAETAGLSPFHFARGFRQSMGRSPHQYLIERRVARAREMLASGRVSVGEAAAAVGFADQSHLSRHFKRIVGVTPGRFLRGA